MTRPLFARLEQEDDFQHWGQNLLRDLDSLFTTDGPALVLSREHIRMNVPLVRDPQDDRRFTCRFRISRDPEMNPYALVTDNNVLVPYGEWVLEENPQAIVFTFAPTEGHEIKIPWLLCRI